MDCTESTGRRIGTVTEVYDTYFTCDTGHLGRGLELYIPYRAIDQVEQGQVILKESGYQIDEQDWYRRPAEAGPAPEAPAIDTAFEPDVPVLGATTGGSVTVRFSIRVGMRCLGSDRVRVGVVTEVGDATFTCHPDQPSIADLHISYEAVSRVEDDDVYLHLPAAQVARGDWQ